VAASTGRDILRTGDPAGAVGTTVSEDENLVLPEVLTGEDHEEKDQPDTSSANRRRNSPKGLRRRRERPEGSKGAKADDDAPSVRTAEVVSANPSEPSKVQQTAPEPTDADPVAPGNGAEPAEEELVPKPTLRSRLRRNRMGHEVPDQSSDEETGGEPEDPKQPDPAARSNVLLQAAAEVAQASGPANEGGTPPPGPNPDAPEGSGQEEDPNLNTADGQVRAENWPKWGFGVAALISAAALFILLHGVLRVGLIVLVVVAGTWIVLPLLLDRYMPKRFDLPQEYPKRGARGAFWWLAGKRLYARVGWEWLPAISWSERDRKSRNGLWENRWVQKTIGSFNSKGGGGKTTAATWFAVIWSFFTRRHIVAMDVNHGPGGTATRLGINREDTIQLREFLELCVKGQITTYEKFAKVVQWHEEADVSVIASGSRSVKPLWDHMVMGLTVAKSVAHGLVCDPGNSIGFVNDLATFYKVDTPIFTAIIRSGDSLKDMTATMQEYAELGFKDKVGKSIVVIFGGKLRHRKRYAERYSRFGITLDQVFVVPFNRYMENGNKNPDADTTKVVSRTRVPRKVRVTLQEALLAAILAEPSSDQVSEDFLRKIATQTGSPEVNLELLPAAAGSRD
jgi:hypothetical protein